MQALPKNCVRGVNFSSYRTGTANRTRTTRIIDACFALVRVIRGSGFIFKLLFRQSG